MDVLSWLGALDNSEGTEPGRSGQLKRKRYTKHPLSPAHTSKDSHDSMSAGERDAEETPRAKRYRNDDVISGTDSTRSSKRSSPSKRSSTSQQLSHLEVAEDGGIAMMDMTDPSVPESLYSVVDALEQCARGLRVLHPDLKVCHDSVYYSIPSHRL